LPRLGLTGEVDLPPKIQFLLFADMHAGGLFDLASPLLIDAVLKGFFAHFFLASACFGLDLGLSSWHSTSAASATICWLCMVSICIAASIKSGAGRCACWRSRWSKATAILSTQSTPGGGFMTCPPAGWGLGSRPWRQCPSPRHRE